jgi:Tol biopolymer transport system component
LAVAVIMLGVVAGPASSAAGAGPSTVRVSVSAAGAEANAASGQGGVVVSGDGRFVAFVSDASNLVAGDGNGVADVFVRDLRSKTTERVSVSSAEVEGDAASSAGGLAISPGGRFVTFTSLATNLAPGNDDSICAPDPCPDTYIRDRTAGTTRMLVPFDGVSPAVDMRLSAGARYFAFDGEQPSGIAWCRRSPRKCVEADVLPPSVKVDRADADAYLGGMSLGGRFILFRKIGGRDPGSVSAGGVFLRDVATRTTHIVTVNPLDRASALSPQGRFILFTSRSKKLVKHDTNKRSDVFIRDRRTGATRRISVSSNEHESNGSSLGIAISSHGRYCLFSSTATNLVAGDTNGERDLFLRDRTLGTTVRIDVSSSGSQSNGPVRFSALSADGRWAAFGSPATNLVATDTNSARDVFSHGPLH